MAPTKMTKNQMRRAKKKEQKKADKEAPEKEDTQEKPVTDTDEIPSPTPEVKKDKTIPDEGIHIPDDMDDDDPTFAIYKQIFSKFGASNHDDEISKEANAGNTGSVFFNDDDDIPSEDETQPPRLSKKKRKALTKLSVAELKALVRIPEVVEWQDVSSSDPRLLVQIKAQRNVVPVPNHWSLKREYLSSKRGIEKAAFRLPAFIAETGITEMRDAVLEKQAEQTLKQKQRERVAPKMGKLDIDYQKLYDAFFRFQTKPELTRFGEVYYEGKEGEVDYQHFRPGDLSESTREALGMPPGAPPPWLINQQRIGTPPNYPTIKIPGLNAPPPPGGSWGFHPGGWGKPPVDEYNRPLYGGDVFGLTAAASSANAAGVAEPVERNLWGELQPREEESEEEEEESDEESDDEDEDEEKAGLETPSGLETPGGYASTVTDFPTQGIETSVAGEMDLRKSGAPKTAHTILPERAVSATGFFGSAHGYDLSSAAPVLGQEDNRNKRKKPGDVDVAINPDEGLTKEEMARRYEEAQKREGVGARWAHEDDLSAMIAEESRKRQRMEGERAERKREGRYRF